jgi:hypothetical protein
MKQMIRELKRQAAGEKLEPEPPAKRGPKSAARNPLAAELVQARRENAQLGRCHHRAILLPPPGVRRPASAFNHACGENEQSLA